MNYNERPTPHDPQWKGPLKNRSCTDIPCLLIFIIFVACWISVGLYAFKNADIQTLLAPTDSDGKRCGIDSEVADSPYLVFFDLSKCLNSRCNTPQVCVNECPSSNWRFDETENIAKIRNETICKNGLNISNKNIAEIKKLVNKKACAKWHLKSTAVVGRCVPTLIPTEYLDLIKTDELARARDIIDYLYKAGGIFNKVISSQYYVYGFICAGALLCMIFIVMLKWIALPCVCITILGVIVILGWLAVLSYQEYENEEKVTGNGSKEWRTFAIVLGIIDGIFILLTCCMWNRIYLACQLIKEASKAVMASISSLFFPIIPWLGQLAVIIYFAAAGICLVSIGEKAYSIEITDKINNLCKCSSQVNYTEGSSCQLDEFNKNCKEENYKFCISQSCHFQGVEGPPYIQYYYAIHIVGGIWALCFISALGEMVLAATFATWYWTKDKSNIPFFVLLISIWRTIRYHLGTVAFGSLLITIVRSFRYLLEYVHAQSMQQPGAITVGISQTCHRVTQCLLMILEKFLKFMNRNAYIVCAIYGKGLCLSAADAMSLIMRNILRVVILNKIVDWLLFAGKILVSCIMAIATWYYYTMPENYDEYWWVPVILVYIGTYLVASVFFNVHEMAVDTIFLCFLEDCERHDGSPEKPYYMTRKLAKLMNLENS